MHKIDDVDPLDLHSEGGFVGTASLNEIQPVRRNLQEMFQYDRYDWNDPGFLAKNIGPYAYRPVLLTQGYFMMVSPWDYGRITTFRDGSPKYWNTYTRKDEEGRIFSLYARRSGRGDEPSTVYAHRELTRTIHRQNGEADHRNGFGLDNRLGTLKLPVNLQFVSKTQNNHNRICVRTVHYGLPPGVELRANGRYGGIRSRRLDKKRVVTIRSKRTWPTAEEAARWYRNQLKKLYGRTAWSHAPASTNEPFFPPRLDSEMDPDVLELRLGHRVVPVDENVPF